MKSLLLIGGTGFFGKSFLDSFQRGELKRWNIGNIVVISRHAEQLKILAPHLLDDRIELINLDICKADVLPKADYVIHAASSTDARNYLHQPEIEKYNTHAGIHNYCRLAPIFHAESKILYVSSGAVYGTQSPEISFLAEGDMSLGYDNMLLEKRGYAAAKLDAENTVQQLGIKFGLSINIARCFSFLGPWLPRDQHFAIGNFIRDGIEGRPIKVIAEHQVIRSYMYADDLVQWLMSIVDNSSPGFDIFNVGSDEEIEVRDLASIIAKKFGVGLDFPMIQNRTIDRYVPSVNKAKSLLNLSMRVDLNVALDKTIERVTQRKRAV